MHGTSGHCCVSVGFPTRVHAVFSVHQHCCYVIAGKPERPAGSTVHDAAEHSELTLNMPEQVAVLSTRKLKTLWEREDASFMSVLRTLLWAAPRCNNSNASPPADAAVLVNTPAATFTWMAL